jgi:hypothetical protein
LYVSGLFRTFADETGRPCSAEEAPIKSETSVKKKLIDHLFRTKVGSRCKIESLPVQDTVQVNCPETLINWGSVQDGKIWQTMPYKPPVRCHPQRVPQTGTEHEEYLKINRDEKINIIFGGFLLQHGHAGRRGHEAGGYSGSPTVCSSNFTSSGEDDSQIF